MLPGPDDRKRQILYPEKIATTVEKKPGFPSWSGEAAAAPHMALQWGQAQSYRLALQ